MAKPDKSKHEQRDTNFYEALGAVHPVQQSDTPDPLFDTSFTITAAVIAVVTGLTIMGLMLYAIMTGL